MHVRRHLVGYLALFVALGGVSFAAVTQLPRNSVEGRHLRTGAVTSAKVRDGTLRPKDFRAGTLRAGPRGPQGPTGATGATGASGQNGATGPPGPTASGAASTSDDFAIQGTNTVQASDPVQAAVTTTFRARLVATGSVQLKNSGASPTEVMCSLHLDPPPPSVAAGTPLSQTYTAALPAGGGTTLTMTGRSAPLDAGTHHVGLHCLSTDGATADVSDITVIAVGE